MKSATFIRRILTSAAGISVIGIAQATPITLINADFQASGHDSVPTGWTAGGDSTGNGQFVYASGGGIPSGTRVLGLKRPGNWVEQSFDPGEVTAETFGRFTITFDSGWRNNSSDTRVLGLTFEIRNVTEDRVLASNSYLFPTDVPSNELDVYRVIQTGNTIVLEYDTSDPSLVGDEIALRLITTPDTFSSFDPTGWVDNLSVEAESVFLEVISTGFIEDIGDGLTSEFQVTVRARSGYLYQLHRSPDLSTPFVPVGDAVPGVSGDLLVSHPFAKGSRSRDFFVVSEEPAPPLLQADFEEDDGGFSVVTTSGSDWQRGVPDTAGPGGTLGAGNAPGMNCWGTELGDFTTSGTGFEGYYQNPTVTTLRSPVVDLPTLGSASLRFAEALDLESGDVAQVFVIDSATNAEIGAAIYSALDADDTSIEWGPANGGAGIPLPAEAMGKSIILEWRFSGQADLYAGWYVDDITVSIDP